MVGHVAGNRQPWPQPKEAGRAIEKPKGRGKGKSGGKAKGKGKASNATCAEEETHREVVPQ